MRGTFEEPPTGLIHWFSKTEGNTYANIAASPFPLQGKPTQAQDIALTQSNLFTQRNTYAILREATSETYGPRVYLLSYKLSIYLYLHLYFSYLYYKIAKVYLSYHIISNSLSDLTLVSDCEGIDNPLSCWLRGVICFV